MSYTFCEFLNLKNDDVLIWSDDLVAIFLGSLIVISKKFVNMQMNYISSHLSGVEISLQSLSQIY